MNEPAVASPRQCSVVVAKGNSDGENAIVVDVAAVVIAVMVVVVVVRVACGRGGRGAAPPTTPTQLAPKPAETAAMAPTNASQIRSTSAFSNWLEEGKQTSRR